MFAQRGSPRRAVCCRSSALPHRFAARGRDHCRSGGHRRTVLWALLRFASGLSHTTGRLLVSGLALNGLIRNGHRPVLGLYFTGLGLGIVVSGLAIAAMQRVLNWAQQWTAFGVLGLVFLAPAWAWLPAPAPATAAPAGGGHELLRCRLELTFLAGGRRVRAAANTSPRAPASRRQGQRSCRERPRHRRRGSRTCATTRSARSGSPS